MYAIGLSGAPSNLVTIEVGATEVTLGWAHNSDYVADSFAIHCTQSISSTVNVDLVNSTVIVDLETIRTLDSETNISFAYPITGLEEYTSYTCTVTARNIFGWSPTSETIDIKTSAAGIPMSNVINCFYKFSFSSVRSP